MNKIEVGDRVKMDTTQEGWLGTKVPDLGVGTVVATEGEGLMTGWYVSVEWDEYHGSSACFPAIQSLVRVDA